MIFIADLTDYSTCFGHHYAHNQELYSIIRVVAACRIWCFGFQIVRMVWSWGLCVRFAPNTTGNNDLYNTLELLMMGIVLPETCWASNKICNKYRLLHLVCILFLHVFNIQQLTRGNILEGLNMSASELYCYYYYCYYYYYYYYYVFLLDPQHAPLQ